MPHNIELITTLAGGLGGALVLGLLTQRLRLSPLVGYLFAGVLVGPFTPGFVANAGLAEQLSEFGVVLLMFGVGLHFHVQDLLKVWRVALPGALAQIAAATGLGVLATQAFGWSVGAGVVFGLGVSVASTVVLIRVLSDSDALQTSAGHVAVGWLVIEDIFTVLALVILPAAAAALGGGGDRAQLAVALGEAVLRIGLLVALLFGVGGKLIPRLLGYVAATRSRELFTLAVLVVALGIAVASALVFGVSLALGAFLAGMIVGRSELSARAASEALPLRDAFAVLFFVSVGMLLDPSQLAVNAKLIAATVAVVLIGKSVVAFAVVRLMRHPVRTAVTVALALAQIGEFSFILASMGRELGILPPVAMQVLVVTAIITITLSPPLFRLVDPLTRMLGGSGSASAPAHEARASGEHGAIVIGYGPVGQTLVRLLREHHIDVTVVELNLDTVRRVQALGLRAVHGDAAQRGILESAGAEHARSLIFAASGSPPEAVISAARELNPALRILARTSYARETSGARRTGADVVVSAEAEVALAMTEQLLSELGATPEQLDRARALARQDFAESA